MSELHYSEVAAEGDLATVRSAAELVAEHATVRVLRDPVGAMVMVRHVDPLQHTPFYLGEAHVTECEVDVDGVPGYGCVLGDSDERALIAAIIDAVMASSAPIRESVAAMLGDAARALEERRREESARVAATRVDFDLA